MPTLNAKQINKELDVQNYTSSITFAINYNSESEWEDAQALFEILFSKGIKPRIFYAELEKQDLDDSQCMKAAEFLGEYQGFFARKNKEKLERLRNVLRENQDKMDKLNPEVSQLKKTIATRDTEISDLHAQLKDKVSELQALPPSSEKSAAVRRTKALVYSMDPNAASVAAPTAAELKAAARRHKAEEKKGCSLM